MNREPYELLARRLDALPNGFPPTADGAELRLLAKIYTPEEAQLAAQLRLTLETPTQLSGRIGGDPKLFSQQLKSMARKGLIKAGRTEEGLGYGLLPFVVGVYEFQIGRMDAELARLFEAYFQQAFGQMLPVKPNFHRVIPVDETVGVDMEVRPFESAVDIIASANAWGVQDCICRKQKALINDPCDHPVEVCMVFSKRPGAFDDNTIIRALTQEEAVAVLKRAAEAGLVHSVSNIQEGMYYICNCCTCACGILRGLSDLGIANVVARSAFVNHVDPALCQGCETCLTYCQFGALSTSPDGLLVEVNQVSCVGCGVCVPACPEDALRLVRRPAEDVPVTPLTEQEWLAERAKARGLDLEQVA
jgi:Pyruvate/2-oxoacid:ferredoxin oxidoreductase delta subunit